MADHFGSALSPQLMAAEPPAPSYLPRRETGSAHQMSAGLDLHVLVVLGADLTQLESGAHLAVQLILLLAGETN